MTDKEQWWPFIDAVQSGVKRLQQLGVIRRGDSVCIGTSLGRVTIRFGEKPICPECKAPLDN